eukprot:752527-Hanusia_phi.AAC.1
MEVFAASGRGRDDLDCGHERREDADLAGVKASDSQRGGGGGEGGGRVLLGDTCQVLRGGWLLPRLRGTSWGAGEGGGLKAGVSPDDLGTGRVGASRVGYINWLRGGVGVVPGSASWGAIWAARPASEELSQQRETPAPQYVSHTESGSQSQPGTESGAARYDGSRSESAGHDTARSPGRSEFLGIWDHEVWKFGSQVGSWKFGSLEVF